MSFIVRMRYCPDTDSCQVVIQPHYSTENEHEEGVRKEIMIPLSLEIRATLGEKVRRKTCAYISASSEMDEDNLADLFILYLFISNEGTGPGNGVSVSGVYQMNLAFRTFAPEMEEIAVNALERCLSLIRKEWGKEPASSDISEDLLLRPGGPCWPTVFRPPLSH
jgi:hypothetical protein